ncbi:AAA family ATPase [Patescibacteria group bacterium]|nr:AAA family ATPase [Patescibacteria group bacterium]
MRLILLNGPCGVGKSTVAEIVHRQLPGSVLVNLDTLRRFVSGHRELRAESHDMSIALTAAMLKACAQHETDAIVDKMLYDETALDTFTRTVTEQGGIAYEFLLWADKETVLTRSDVRGYRPNGLFTREKCLAFWEAMDGFRKQRSSADVIDTTTKTPAEIAAYIMKKVS